MCNHDFTSRTIMPRIDDRIADPIIGSVSKIKRDTAGQVIVAACSICSIENMELYREVISPLYRYISTV